MALTGAAPKLKTNRYGMMPSTACVDESQVTLTITEDSKTLGLAKISHGPDPVPVAANVFDGVHAVKVEQCLRYGVRMSDDEKSHRQFDVVHALIFDTVACVEPIDCEVVAHMFPNLRILVLESVTSSRLDTPGVTNVGALRHLTSLEWLVIQDCGLETAIVDVHACACAHMSLEGRVVLPVHAVVFQGAASIMERRAFEHGASPKVLVVSQVSETRLPAVALRSLCVLACHMTSVPEVVGGPLPPGPDITAIMEVDREGLPECLERFAALGPRLSRVIVAPSHTADEMDAAGCCAELRRILPKHVCVEPGDHSTFVDELYDPYGVPESIEEYF